MVTFGPCCSHGKSYGSLTLGAMGIEVQVHRQLLQLLRSEQLPTAWPHQLTMGRLVARALYQGRSTLVQVSGSGEHRLSYLLPALSAPEPVILCANESIQQQLLDVDLPLLRRNLATEKPIGLGDRWPGTGWRGVLITEPLTFLRDRLRGGSHFPEGVAVIFDGAHCLEQWAIQALSERIEPADWDDLREGDFGRAEFWLDWQVGLSRALSSQPHNRTALGPNRQAALASALGESLPSAAWRRFRGALSALDRVHWVQYYRQSNQFSLVSSPIAVADALAHTLWPRQPAVVIGEALDPAREARTFRSWVGLGEVTCLRFPADLREQEVQLYLPTQLSDPTASHYRQQIEPVLVELAALAAGPLVILLPEGPLRSHLGTFLAAQFGSRVGIHRLQPPPNGITLASWEFWEANHHHLGAPTTLAVCALPFPRLDDPLVAARVQWLKAGRRDWFREYLLPVAIGRLQRGISPLRQTQGLVALLDNRINHRSYGGQLLDALTPARRLRYLE